MLLRATAGFLNSFISEGILCNNKIAQTQYLWTEDFFFYVLNRSSKRNSQLQRLQHDIVHTSALHLNNLTSSLELARESPELTTRCPCREAFEHNQRCYDNKLKCVYARTCALQSDDESDDESDDKNPWHMDVGPFPE